MTITHPGGIPIEADEQPTVWPLQRRRKTERRTRRVDPASRFRLAYLIKPTGSRAVSR